MHHFHRHVSIDAKLASPVHTRHGPLAHELLDSEVILDDSPDERVFGVIEPCGLWHAA